MAGTLELAAVIDYATARGASVRLVGDDRQLAAVGAGGVLRDIDRTHGAVTLSEVRRFTHADGSPNHAEAAASLAIRRGEPAGLGYYLDHEPHPRRRRHDHRRSGVRRLVGRPCRRPRHAAHRVHQRAGPGAEPARASRPAGDCRRTGGTSRRRSPTERRSATETRSSPAATTVASPCRPPTGSPTATAGPSPRSVPTAHSRSGTRSPTGASPCPPTTSPSTSNSATPAPSTPRRARPSTPATRS